MSLPNCDSFENVEVRLARTEKQIKAISASLASIDRNFARLVDLMEARFGPAKPPSPAEGPSSRVVLNVGGTRFETSRSTLLRFEGTYFSGLLGPLGKPDADGSYFIDRDPMGMDVVLNYLRDGELDLEALESKSHPLLRSRVQQLLEFFLIPIPLDPWSRQLCSTHLKIDGPSITKTSGGNKWNAAVLGKTPNPGAFRLKVSFLSKDRIVVGLIGLNSKKNFEPQKENSQERGYYMVVPSGVLYGTRSRSIVGMNLASKPQPISNGSVITIRLDAERKEVRFLIDGALHTAYFNNIDLSEPLYPAIELWEQDAAFEYLEGE